MRKILVVLTLATALAPAAKAEEPGTVMPTWLKAVGEFIQSEIEPPRLAEDLLREEEEKRLAHTRRSEPTDEEPDPAPEPAPEFFPEPAAYTPPEPDWEASPLPAATAAPANLLLGPHPQPAVEVSPPAKPQPAAAQQPKPASAASPTLPAFPAAEPIAPADRIAGTATLNQALKLGGPAELYARPIRPPGPAVPIPVTGELR